MPKRILQSIYCLKLTILSVNNDDYNLSGWRIAINNNPLYISTKGINYKYKSEIIFLVKLLFVINSKKSFNVVCCDK